MQLLRATVLAVVTVTLVGTFGWNQRSVASPGLAVTSISGSVAHGASLTLSGSGFGVKSSATPRKYDSFEAGANNSVLAGGWTVDNTYPPTYSTQIVRPNSTKSVRSNFINGTWASNFGITGESMPRVYFDAWYYYSASPPYSRNHKVFRFHANRVNTPNLYYNLYCQGKGSHLSQDGVSGGHFDVWPSLGPEYFANKWSHLQGYFVQSSGGVDDGTAIMWVDGVLVANEVRNFRTRDSASPAWDTLWFGNFLDHGADGYCAAYPADAYTYWDDVYVDYSQARVEIGDAPVYSASRHREIQLPSSWSDGSITITLNKGSFPNFSGLYLFVIDDAGNASPGFAIAAAGPDTTAPTIAAVTPATGTLAAPLATVTATFSEAMNAASITTTTFELRDPSSAKISAAVAYDSTTRTATLTPAAPLGAQVSYTATVKGTASGVKDVAGNPLAAHYVWSFSTSSANGPVAAYAFDEATGSSVTDGSGNNNTGSLTGATRVSGKAGGGLAFDGVSGSVTIPDSASLDLTTGMTMEAWVNPTALTGWRTVILKEMPGDLAYALYASEGSHPVTVATLAAKQYDHGTAAIPLNTWTYLAGTYDGTALKLYVNGTLVSSQPVTGTIATSTAPLRIGGNSVWGEYFAGAIDEVRVYNRALSGAEIQSDMTTPVRTTHSPAPPQNVRIIR